MASRGTGSRDAEALISPRWTKSTCLLSSYEQVCGGMTSKFLRQVSRLSKKCFMLPR